MNQRNQNNQINNPEKKGQEFDLASQSLSEALRISFKILKVIMIILVVLFLASGFKTVESGERALVLRFGKIRGVGEERLLEPGLHWVLPYPIDEVISIPVTQKSTLSVNSFWYYQSQSELLGETPDEKQNFGPTLNPVRDGYCLTRSANKDTEKAGFSQSDYNIIHTQWQITWQIQEPERFFSNVYVDVSGLEAGQNYSDAIASSVNPMLRTIIEDAVVSTMVHYTIDQALFERVAAITEDVKSFVQSKLTEIKSGIHVDSIQLNRKTWPRQVDSSFQASIRASQRSQTLINEARTYAENTLTEAAGPVGPELHEAINNPDADPNRVAQLWRRAAGQAQEKLAQARAYRTKVVENAKASAEYLNQIFPEYRKRPKLVVQKIYQDAVQQVLNNAKEKMIIQPTETSDGKELRILLNRDPQIDNQKENQGQQKSGN